MREITAEESQKIMSVLSGYTDWGHVYYPGTGLEDSASHNPEELARQFLAFLNNGGRMAVITAWTFTIPGGRDPESGGLFGRRLRAHATITSRANDLLGRLSYPVPGQEDDVRLAVLMACQLCRTAVNNTVEHVFEGARLLGLQECSAYDGPLLRDYYRTQPRGERIRMGMRPVEDRDGIPCVFTVGRNIIRKELDAMRAVPDDVCPVHSFWAFRWPEGTEG